VAPFQTLTDAMPPTLSQLVLDDRLRHWRLGAALLMFALIVALGSIPGARAEIGTFASGLVLHSIAYSCVTFLLFTGTSGTQGQRAAKAVLGALAMGAVDELVQSMLPYRVGAVGDWMVDGASAMLTASLLWMLLPAPLPAGARQA
jgi:hypothetical protein